MSTENKNAEEEEKIESDDDGFEVLDPEPKDEVDDFKCTSRNDFPDAGTIIFCHMDDEYKGIQQVSCQYIRPEGWTEQEKDEIAIFEVGWINTEEAVARIPVDRTISSGFPLGSVNLTDFAFREEEYAPCPGAVTHFQICYLRDGLLLGASTPFGIQGIKAVGRLSISGEKPFFFSLEKFEAERGSSTGSPFEKADSLTPDSLSTFEMPTVGSPAFNCAHDQLYAEKGAVHDIAVGLEAVNVSGLQSSLRNLTALTKQLHDTHSNDRSRTSMHTTGLIMELNKSVDELAAEMHKATGVLPSNTSMTSTTSSKESCEDLEQRLSSCAEQLKANMQDCTRALDLCKNVIKNQTPPSSLSEIERSNFFKETEEKRQQETEEVNKQLKNALGEVEKLREELACKEDERRGLSEQLGHSKSHIAKLEADCQALSESLAEVKGRLYDRQNDIKKMLTRMISEERRYLSRVATMRDQIERMEVECQKLRDIRDGGIEADELRGKLKEVEETYAAKKREMENSNNNLKRLLIETSEELSLKDASYRKYVTEAEAEKRRTELKTAAVAEESSVLKSQIKTLLDEAKLYKSKLGDTILELTNSRQMSDDLKAQCKNLLVRLNFLENEKVELEKCIANLKEKLEAGQQPDNAADVKQDDMVQEFLKKSEELDVAKKQVDYFQEELSRLNAQRTNLQKELLEAKQNPAPCGKPCCTFEISPGTKQTDHVVDSILEALEQSFQENKRLESELEAEKKRSQTLEEKLQSAAGKYRNLYMKKIILESSLKEILGSD